MKFFVIVFITLFCIGAFDLTDTIVQILLLPKVYACAEVKNTDPINVQKACKKYEHK
jgi:hypothetical protein